jgi:ketosteroid isomerase-like protein
MTDEDAVLAANAAYYDAFAEGNVDGMSRLWASDEVSCIHPGWPVLVGRQVVLNSYRNILRNPDRERIAHRDHTVMIAGSEARVLCLEVIDGTGVALAATNLFRRIEGSWRLVHHQASPIASLFDEAPEPASAPPSKRLN